MELEKHILPAIDSLMEIYILFHNAFAILTKLVCISVQFSIIVKSCTQISSGLNLLKWLLQGEVSEGFTGKTKNETNFILGT